MIFLNFVFGDFTAPKFSNHSKICFYILFLDWYYFYNDFQEHQRLNKQKNPLRYDCYWNIMQLCYLLNHFWLTSIHYNTLFQNSYQLMYRLNYQFNSNQENFLIIISNFLILQLIWKGILKNYCFLKAN